MFISTRQGEGLSLSVVDSVEERKGSIRTLVALSKISNLTREAYVLFRHERFLELEACWKVVGLERDQ